MHSRWAVELIDVHKRIGHERVLRGVDLGMPAGRIGVIVGPPGSGKTLLVRLITGLARPDDGDVLVHGRSVAGMRRGELARMRRGLGIVFQEDGLFGAMSVFDNVAFPLRAHSKLAEAEIARRVHARLVDAGLDGAASRLPGELPLTARRLTGCVRALIADPPLAIFDEPDGGLDPLGASRVCELLEHHQAMTGATCIVVTRDPLFARRIGQHVALLWRGRALDEGDLGEVLDSAQPLVRRYLAGTHEESLSLGLDLGLDQRQ
jgi:phospholipid/cholesterol/gamma-HCH transport system ATP-binding protein